ncbi:MULTISPECIES: hypothetical protein [Mycolicibacterium]|nr:MULTISPECIES: hypothetical protein [Mycolicibacterium]MCV7290452.1 hypothetical protein [Mycolicibacterium wolinskyi]MCV7297012.1 hypothetical protein [Mycolicibacterium goodii]
MTRTTTTRNYGLHDNCAQRADASTPAGAELGEGAIAEYTQTKAVNIAL